MKKAILAIGAIACLLTACSKTESTPDSQHVQTTGTERPLAKGKDEKMLDNNWSCKPGGGGCIEVVITGRCPSLVQAEIYRQLDNGQPQVVKDLFANTEENKYLPAELLTDSDFMELVNKGQIASKLLNSNDTKRVYAFGTQAQLTANQHIYAVPFN